ncbi:MAG TPA: 2-amino-4-hydroxy-6-hydroxymethyldihydropteridine diphosphokinase [Alphaproteobacteria bacterium]|nr:2-amino-4-hydroxy-6-hydroxymethyldihydropteridine diphosphokinase [Alphaproteobacteria bacterium]
MTVDPETIALGLGSNIGDRKAALRAAVEGLAPYMKVSAVSPIYETAAFYVTDQPAFLNAAVVGTTTLSPLVLLRAVKNLEVEVGRQPSFRYGPRLLDIDILFYGRQSFISPELTVPHPRLAEREFVLRPLADIAPNWKHPASGLTIADMLASVPPSGAKCLGPLMSDAA